MESNDISQEQLGKANGELATKDAELLRSKGSLQCVLDHINDMVFVTDGDGLLTFFNKQSEKVLGYAQEQVTGRPIHDLVGDPEEFEKLNAVCKQKGGASRSDFPLLHRAGHMVHLDVSLHAFVNSEGQLAGMVGVCRDNTLGKELQEDLIHVDRLAEIGRTISAIAHEIRNPLAIINEISGWMKAIATDAEGLNQKDREELEAAISDISEQTRRCRGITDQVLSFARDSAHTKASFDVHELLKETVNFLNPELKFKDIDVVFDFMEEPLLVDSDQQQFEQILVNLLSNAVYAIKEKGQRGGRILLKTSKSESMAEIKISDSGTGISEEGQKKMFDLFYTTKPPGKGTGLGLPICQNILKKLGGDLSFESKFGEGTTFIVKVPAL